MHRVVRIQIRQNIGTGMLISLENDIEHDVILTVCHIFGEDYGDKWGMWGEVNIDEVKVTSYYYDIEFEVTDILYKNGDAENNDFALIYIKKFKKSTNEENPYIPKDETCILNNNITIEGYAREEENNATRVIDGELYDFTDDRHIFYRVNYFEKDREDKLSTAQLNKGMSGAPVFLKNENNIFVGMQKMVSGVRSKDGILGVFNYRYCLEKIKSLYNVDLPLVTKEKERIIKNDSLFKCVHVIQQEFDIIPNSKCHFGASIEYKDIQEVRESFLEELIDTMINWVYSSEKYEEILKKIVDNGKSEMAACSQIHNKVHKQFRRENDEELSALGQIGELLLSHFIQRYLKAVPILRKEEIRVTSNSDSICKNAIHYKKENDKNIIILGEAKCYTSKYSFNEAFKESIDSIISTYKNYESEKELYVHEDFLDKDMNEIAETYINGTMIKPQVNLVSITIYNEDKELDIVDEDEIRKQIDTIIEERYSKFNNDYIDIRKYPILNRITYIIFPVWKIEELVKEYEELL